MLTRIQKESLYNLMINCPFPKLKLVLEKSIPKWISGEIQPKQLDLGLAVENDIFVSNYQKACCLVGTSLIGEKAKYKSGNPWKTFCIKFNIDELITEKLMSSFDSGKCYGFPESEYIVKIHKILFD